MSFYLPILLQRYATNPLNKDLNLNGYRAVNSVDPVLNTDLATKNYVDITAGGGGASTGTLPFSLVSGATVVGQFTNPSGNDLQLTAPTTTGKLIFTDIHGVDFTNSPATFTNNTGTVIQVSPSGATKGLRISGNNDPNQPLLEIASSGGERHITSSRSGVVQQSQVYINDTTTGGLSMIELSKGNNGSGISMTKSGTGDGILITNNGSGYALSTAGTKGDVQIAGTLDQNGRIVQTSGGGQDTFLLTHPSGVGDGLHIVKNGTTGHALNIENNGTGNAINAIISTATGGIYIQKNTSSGVGIPLQINHQNNFTLGQSSIDVNHNSNAVGVNIANAGSTGTMLLTQTGAGYGLNVNKVSGSGNCVVVSNSGSGLLASLTSSGTGISYTHNNTGANAGLTYTKSSGTGGRMVDLTYSNSGSDDVVRIDRSSGGGSGNMLNLISTTNGVLINATNSGTASNIVLTNSSTSGSSANASFVKTGTGNGDNVFIRNTDTVGASTGNALSILNQGVGDCLRIQDEAGDTSLFRIDGDGNVGIGVPTTALTSKFVSNGGSGNTTTQILQTNTGISTAVTDTTAGSAGTSQISINSTNTDIAGRSDITLEPSRGTATSGTTPRIRMTVASGSNNGILLQGNNASGGTNFRFGFTSGSTGESAMNVYGDVATRRVRIGQQDIYTGIPSGVLELTRNATPHGTSIPHILLNGTNATGGVVMNCNAGRIENVADPTNPQDVATRAYVLANAGGTPTQIATGQNRFVTNASGINQQADAGQSMNMGINNNGQKNIQSYGPNVLINVPSGATTNDTQVMEAWSSSITGSYTTSSTDLAFAIKPRTNQAYVGRFTGTDIQNIGPTANGVLQIWKNSGIHSTAPHLRLVGADSPVLSSSIAINCNGAGRITGVIDPTTTNDVMNAKVESVVGSDLISRSTIASYLRPVLGAPLISYFYNASGAFGANATTRGSNPHYLLCSDCAPSNSFAHSTSVLSLCPIEFKTATLNGFGAVTAGIWKMNRVGVYRITYEFKAGAFPNGSAFTDASFSSLLIYQGADTGIAPTSTSPYSCPPYNATRRRVSSTGYMLCNQLEFYIVNDGTSNCFTFGSSNSVPQNWESFTVSSFYSLLTAEYMGNTYA